MQPGTVPYCGSPPVPGDVASAWNVDPLVPIVLAAAFLACRKAGARPLPLLAGLAVLLLLFASPLCALGSALFAARAGHHLLLTALAAPLMALALPGGGRHLAAWALIHAAVFWAWHLPAAYALALASDGAYWLMQASLLVSATGLWRAVRAAPAPAGIAGLLATMMQMGLLGALLTFAKVPLYVWHTTTTQSWGLLPLEDQQLAGLIMWVVGGGIYLAAALRLAGAWLGERQRYAAT